MGMSIIELAYRFNCVLYPGFICAKYRREANLREEMSVLLSFLKTAMMLTTMLVAQDEAPSGMLARGHYEAVSKFVDDDDHTHLKFEWSFDIAKEWK